MKNIFRLFLLVTFTLVSCTKNQAVSEKETSEIETSDNNVATADFKAESKKINDFLKQYEEPSQVFKVTAGKPTKVIGKQGTIISINPADLVMENGQAIGKNIEVELKELTNQEQLFRTNAPTTSNGKLLVSGGAYYINITSGGEQLKLKEGKTLSVEFPKITSKEMALFYGERDSLRQLNWQSAGQNFVSKPKQPAETAPAEVDSLLTEPEMDDLYAYLKKDNKRPLTKEEKKAARDNKKNSILENKVYKAINLKQFGWINCDRFYDIPKKTDLLYAFDEKESVSNATVYLIFKDMNSVMQNSFISVKNKNYNSVFRDIPVGAKTQLIAFSIKNGKTYAYKTALTIKPKESIKLTLKETSQDEIEKLFDLN
ncbi:hypothetical protein [Flavobacterium pedocola]